MIRRAIGTTLAGLCALTGPLAGGSFAAATTSPALTASTNSTRPGMAFTVGPAATGLGCPAAAEAQTVEMTFTDAAGQRHSLGSAETGDDGSWAAVTVLLPVGGLDTDGAWSDHPVALGAGTVSAACFTADSSPDDGDDSGSDDGDDSTEDDDSTGDGVSDEPTLTYPGIPVGVVGSAPQLTRSASVLKPGDSVTVTPNEGCVTTGPSTVDVALINLAEPSDGGEDGGDNGDSEDGGENEDGENGGGQADGGSSLPTTTVTTSATGSWTGVTLLLPPDSATGDYAVTATCSTEGTLTSRYDAAPLALGTVLISPASCGARSVSAALTGTYSGAITGKGNPTLPAKITLAGDGPWKVTVRSATTGITLASRTIACAKPQYELDVSKVGLSDANKPRARVCNTGRAPVSGVLQVLAGKKYQKVDRETLEPGNCVWLEGSKIDKGSQVKAKVLIDAPGTDSDDTVHSFTVKRGRR